MAMALLVIVHKSMQWTAWKSLPLARWFRSSAVGCLSGKSGRLPRPSTVLQVSVPHHQKTFHLKWKLGESIKDLAEQNEDLMAEYIEGVCGGNLSCSTCHVYIHQPEFKELLEEPSESEADMLDLAFQPTDSSRLRCAIRLTTDMINSNTQLEIKIPEGVTNNWV